MQKIVIFLNKFKKIKFPSRQYRLHFLSNALIEAKENKYAGSKEKTYHNYNHHEFESRIIAYRRDEHRMVRMNGIHGNLAPQYNPLSMVAYQSQPPAKCQPASLSQITYSHFRVMLSTTKAINNIERRVF